MLRSRGLILPLVLAAFIVPGFRQGVCEEATPEGIERLIRQLGHDDVARRTEAAKALEAEGEAVVAALEKAAGSNSDPHVRVSARSLIARIVLRSRSTGLVLVPVRPGSFDMGSLPGEMEREDDEPSHEVRITRSFLIGKHEVTQDEYRTVMKVDPSWFSPAGGGKRALLTRTAGTNLWTTETGRFPVESVTWYDAVEFCNRLSALDGYSPCYGIDGTIVTRKGGRGYRLPTEAEWEYACRAGTKTRFHSGDELTGREANAKPTIVGAYGGNTPLWPDLHRTAKVGSYEPNGFGIHDMHGNVAEWCWDTYEKGFYADSPRDDPEGPARGVHRALRGGSWLVNEGRCRSASRFWHAPDEKKFYAGFRVCRDWRALGTSTKRFY
jgi:formylglycine-generating enzyme required for sulfatase activity